MSLLSQIHNRTTENTEKNSAASVVLRFLIGGFRLQKYLEEKKKKLAVDLQKINRVVMPGTEVVKPRRRRCA